MSRTIWLYPRVSTKEQDDYGTSLPTQIKECHDYIQRNELEGEVVVRPEDYSGLTLDRPVLNTIRAEMQPGDIVLVHRVDRISRDEDATDALILYKQWKRKGVELHTAEDGVIKGTPKLMLLMLKSAMSAEYVISLKANAKRGRRGRAELKQRLLGGYDLYGYTYIHGDRKSATGGYRVVNEKEARRVRYIFWMYTRERIHLNALSLRLQRIGVPPPKGGTRWYPGTLKQLLTNAAYTGKDEAFKSVSHEENVPLPSTPRIIDDITFALAAQRLGENKNRGGKRVYIYEVGGLTYCEDCGSKCKGTTTSSKRTDGRVIIYSYYECRRRHADHDPMVKLGDVCDMPPIPAAAIEPKVWGGVRAYILQPELIEEEIAQRVEAMGERQVETDLETVREALAELAAEKARLIRFAARHEDDAEAVEMVDKELAEIDAKRAPLLTKETTYQQTVDALYLSEAERRDVRALCAAMAEDIDSLDGAGRNEVMRRLHVRVEIGRETVSVTGLFPKFTVEHGADVLPVYREGYLTIHGSNGIPFAFSFPRAA